MIPIPPVEFPRAQFTKLATALREAKNTTAKTIVKQQFKLTIRDAISATPPFDQAGFGRFGHEVSLKAHQLTGRAATKRDIKKVFLPFKGLVIAKGRNHTAVSLRKYAAEGNVHALVTMLRALGVPFNEVVTNVSALPYLHDAKRRRGRVIGKKLIQSIVLDAAALKAYTEEEVSHVGRAKGGWARLAEAAGLRLPAWIMEHAGEPYLYNDQTRDAKVPSITFGNLVEFVDDFSYLEILPKVFEFRLKAMQGELDQLLEAEAKKELAGVKP